MHGGKLQGWGNAWKRGGRADILLRRALDEISSRLSPLIRVESGSWILFFLGEGMGFLSAFFEEETSGLYSI